VLLGKAQPALFDHARARITDMMAPALEVARAPVRGFDRFIGSITEIFSVYEQNLQLKEENARLRQWRNVATFVSSFDTSKDFQHSTNKFILKIQIVRVHPWNGLGTAYMKRTTPI
jgi:hypothetical protein